MFAGSIDSSYLDDFWCSSPARAAPVVARVAGKRAGGLLDPPLLVSTINGQKRRRMVVVALKEVSSSSDFNSECSTAGSSTASERDEHEMEDVYVNLDGLDAVEVQPVGRVLSDSVLPEANVPMHAVHNVVSALAPDDGKMLGQMIDSMLEPSADTAQAHTLVPPLCVQPAVAQLVVPYSARIAADCAHEG